jgi:hypothetical protein
MVAEEGYQVAQHGCQGRGTIDFVLVDAGENLYTVGYLAIRLHQGMEGIDDPGPAELDRANFPDLIGNGVKPRGLEVEGHIYLVLEGLSAHRETRFASGKIRE